MCVAVMLIRDTKMDTMHQSCSGWRLTEEILG